MKEETRFICCHDIFDYAGIETHLNEAHEIPWPVEAKGTVVKDIELQTVVEWKIGDLIFMQVINREMGGVED